MCDEAKHVMREQNIVSENGKNVGEFAFKKKEPYA